MSINLVSLFVLFCSGIAAATFVDFVRHVLLQLPSKFVHKMAVIIEIILWAILGCASFYLLLVVKYGDWRAVDALVQVFGILAYNFWLRGIIHFIGRILTKLFISPVLWIVHIIVVIVRKILRLFIILIKPIRKLTHKKSKFFKKRNLK